MCRHGIPEELLSERGANFLSTLIQEVCQLLGVKKINTSGCHPQTDGLVEKFNSTLISMIAKSCDVRDQDWDVRLPYLLFVYRVSAQESTREAIHRTALDFVTEVKPQITSQSLKRRALSRHDLALAWE